jgi:hypothetical protein
MKLRLMPLFLACSVVCVAQKTTHPPPLQLTVIGANIVGLPNGSYMLMASARFSDAMIAATRKKGLPPGIDKVRFGLMCGGSRPGCVALQADDTYWAQYIYPGDVGYYDDGGDPRLADCHPARFFRSLSPGQKAIAVYYVCVSDSK